MTQNKTRVNVLLHDNICNKLNEMNKDFRGLKLKKGQVIDTALYHFFKIIKNDAEEFDKLVMEYLNEVKD